MKKTAFFLLSCLLLPLLAGCSALAGEPNAVPTIAPTPTEVLVKANGSIGDTTLAQGNAGAPYQKFWSYCGFLPDTATPAELTAACELPKMSGVTLEFGWTARELNLESNWRNMRWSFELDGAKVDLADFKTFEVITPEGDVNNFSRTWNIDLLGLTPGSHNMRIAWQSDVLLNSGTATYQPGVYAHTIDFTVLEPETYPALSLSTQPGFHTFHSEKTGLDLLLYMPQPPSPPASPSDLAQPIPTAQPSQPAPLIIALHGSEYRGVPLSVLQKSVFVSELATQGGLPFIVVAPVGDGGFEFWSKPALKEKVLQLTQEVSELYPVDTKRISLMGDGMGANGVWVLGLENPETFAALLPVGGYYGYPFDVPKNICDLKEVPVRAFHGGKDIFVPAEVEQDLIDALSACGGDANMTMHEESTANSLPFIYRNNEMYSWLALQSK